MERHQEANGFETDSLNITEQEHIFKIHLDPPASGAHSLCPGPQAGRRMGSLGQPLQVGVHASAPAPFVPQASCFWFGFLDSFF